MVSARYFAGLGLMLAGCSTDDVQSSPEQVARAFVHIQSHAVGEKEQQKRAFLLLSPHAKERLAVASGSAMRTLGLRLEAVEMWAPYTAPYPRDVTEVRVTADGEDAALVSLRGGDKEVRLPCVKVQGRWWVEPVSLSGATRGPATTEVSPEP